MNIRCLCVDFAHHYSLQRFGGYIVGIVSSPSALCDEAEFDNVMERFR